MSSHEFIDVSTFLKCSDTEIPKNFQLTNQQWHQISKEVQKILEQLQNNNPSIKDTLNIRQEIQHGLALRFYQITEMAKETIQRYRLEKIDIDELRKAEKGQFIVITETGSIHYLDIKSRHIDFLECRRYERQSYYNFNISENTQLHANLDTDIKKYSITDMQAIRILVTDVGQLQVSKGFRELNGSINYKRIFKSSKIKEIYTSKEIEKASQGFQELSNVICDMNQSFMLDLMDISGIQANEIEDSELFADFSDHFVHLQETYSKLKKQS
ncbi:MAG: hypothetical protein KBC30_07235 [Planctomycetes bacterium]|jgi:hypothetical protein|nr:hypothetical protein [Planctomycetota bacterium]HNZ66015.1 hypothetical protein [Planctomycetota bacterium]HON43814.1 hypothetical protein [Planctomycetota bacterium]HPY74307.1 hypothetical protein [Planctomycetota bacterium]HQA99859.1 hypothetical protein [Planctomycetota bacterium]